MSYELQPGDMRPLRGPRTARTENPIDKRLDNIESQLAMILKTQGEILVALKNMQVAGLRKTTHEYRHKGESDMM